jgi:DNA-binding transcriptional LysR family regulator
MALELRHLRYFLAVAAESNVTRAAAKLGISQPPLSQQLKELERLLDVTLFHRSSQGVSLTAAGEAFQKEALHTLQAAERAHQAAVRAARGQTGTVRVGFTGSAAFNPVVAGTIRDFRRQWPDVEILLEETNTTRLTQMLIHGSLDAAFLRPASSDMAPLTMIRFQDEPMKVVLPSSHPLAARQSVGLAHLAPEAFVLFPRSVGLSLYDAVIEACKASGFEPRLGQQAPQLAAVINLVAAEMGISIVPASLSQIHVTGVSYVDITGPAPVATLGLACRQDNLSPACLNFVQTGRKVQLLESQGAAAWRHPAPPSIKA